jgi:hypothetical protein
VLGSSKGATLRRIARDVDSTDLMLALSKPRARPVRRMAVQTLAQALERGVRKSASSALLTLKRSPPKEEVAGLVGIEPRHRCSFLCVLTILGPR